MSNNPYNSKYVIWLYNLSAREYILLNNYFPSEHFSVVDLQNNLEKFKDIEKTPILDRPDAIICDEQTILPDNIKDLIYSAKASFINVTLRPLQTYTGNTFELSSRELTKYEKKNDEFIPKKTTMIEESLKKIVEYCQLSNIAKLNEITKKQAHKIKNEMDINRKMDEGESLSDISKEYLFKLASKLNGYINLKDNYTAGHSRRVATYSEALAIALGLDEKRVEDVVLAANLHDIGKIALPDAVITKTSGLNDFEYNLMKKHVELGTSILPSNAFNSIKSAIRGHHERLDGTGYPDGLKGDDVPIYAQILAIADSFDAMTSQRSYNKVKSAEEAFNDLLLHTKAKEDGGLGYFYNEELVKTFIKTIKASKTIMDELEKEKRIADLKYEENLEMQANKNKLDEEIIKGGFRHV